jgi:hypothetical protein
LITAVIDPDERIQFKTQECGREHGLFPEIKPLQVGKLSSKARQKNVSRG